LSKKLLSVLGLLMALTLLAAGCGGGEAEPGDTGTTPADTGTAPADTGTEEMTDTGTEEMTDTGTEEMTDTGTEEMTETETGAAPVGDCGDAVTIAYQGPLTGPNAALGINMLNGIQLAVDEANESGELDFMVEIESLDSQGDPAQAPPLAQGAAADDSVVAVIGPSFSGETAASGPIYEQAGLPFLSPSATNPDLSQNGWEYFFRTVATDATQGPVAARFIYENLGATQVAVVDDASEYGKGLADIVEQSLTENGATIVLREGVEAGTQDYSAVVGQIAQSGAEALFYGGYFSDAGLIRRQLVDNGAGDITFVSDDGAFDNALVEVAGADAAEGVWVTFPGADPLSADPAFLEAYNAAFDADPGAFTIEAYQNALILTQALQEVGCDRTAIRDFLDEFSGEVFGKQIEFDDNGDIAAQTFFVYQVENGAFVQQEEVQA
jgi:branched-chain amino acid transport system substrate-binding protein